MTWFDSSLDEADRAALAPALAGVLPPDATPVITRKEKAPLEGLNPF